MSNPSLPQPIYRALIAEDDPILATMLSFTLQNLWPELQLCANAVNGDDAIVKALEQLPDILFLDIKMPGKSGLDAAQELADDWPEETPFPLIVFVTAHDEFALEAFDHAAADYVLKPFNAARLTKTIGRLKERLASRQDNVQTSSRMASAEGLGELMGQLRALLPKPAVDAERLTMVRAAVGNQIRLIPLTEVVYFEASDKYLTVVTADSESLIRTSLKELVPQLDEKHFWQVNRGTIVNMQHIVAAVRDDSGKLMLILRGREERLRVSSGYAHLFKQM